MSEFVVVQVGQCGNQIGGAFWPMVLKEHGILPNETPDKSHIKQKDGAVNSFFHRISNRSHGKEGAFKARAVLIDMEDRVVSRFHRGPLRSLFENGCSLTNYLGSGNNWAVGHYVHGGEHRERIEEMFRVSAEKCSRLNGFLTLFSLGGGTGSGLGSATLLMLEDMFPKTERFAFCVHPGWNNDVITSPYNVALSLNVLINHATCVFPFDNEMLYNICARQRKENATVGSYRSINNVIASAVLNITSGSRFPGDLNLDMSDLSTNLVPFPKLNFLANSTASMGYSKEKWINSKPRLSDLICNICARDYQVLPVNPFEGTCLGCVLHARGAILLSSLEEFSNKLKSRVKFPHWANPGIKSSLCTVPACDQTVVLLSLTNSTSMSDFFQKNLRDFEKIYKRRALIHHYEAVDGFDGSDFVDAKESILNVINTYQKSCREVRIPRLQVI